MTRPRHPRLLIVVENMARTNARQGTQTCCWLCGVAEDRIAASESQRTESMPHSAVRNA
jgi:hypothetical protein